MRGQIHPYTAALLILMLQTMVISCSKISTETGDDGVHVDPRLHISFNGYIEEPAVRLHPYTTGEISERCQEDLYQLLNFTSPAFEDEFRALDAFGKPAAGFMEGNVAWLGNYDECMALEGFNYCLAFMSVNITTNQSVPPPVIRWGVCPPASCSGEDVKNALQDMIAVFGEMSSLFDKITTAMVQCNTSPHIPYSAGFICTVILLLIIGALVVAGTLYDEYLKYSGRRSSEGYIVNRRDGDDDALLGQEACQSTTIIHFKATPQGILGRFLLCFSVTHNLTKLLDTQQKDNSISSLNGIRFISMTWVILGHTFICQLMNGTTQNIFSLSDWLINDLSFQALANAFFAVDSFFFLSGFLISYLTMSRMQELKSAKAWLWFYFHRYWRLTPLLVFTILIWMYIQPFFGEGPLWQLGTSRTLCQKYWWTDLLYINNFYPKSFSQQCIGWTWYLANDMQFFIISPLILVPLYYASTVGWIVLSALAIVCVAVTGVIIGVYDLQVNILGLLLQPATEPGIDYNSLVYGKPYCRIAPYLVGIGLGYIMHRTGKRQVKMPTLLALAGWVVAAGIGVSVVYGLYPSYKPDYQMTRAANIIYGSVSRFGWGIALAWVVYACKYGYGGWINKFLSWTGWIPLSRLTYCAYMFHPLVVLAFFYNFGTGVYMSKYLLAYYFVGNVAVSYFVAMIVAITIEYPFVNLEKLLMPNNPRERQKRSQADPIKC